MDIGNVQKFCPCNLASCPDEARPPVTSTKLTRRRVMWTLSGENCGQPTLSSSKGHDERQSPTEDVTMEQFSLQNTKNPFCRVIEKQAESLERWHLLPSQQRSAPSQPPPPKKELRMKFQKAFLDFSGLDLGRLEQEAQQVAAGDYGTYSPALVKVIIRPLPPFSTLTKADREMIEEADRNHMNEEIDKENSSIQGAVKGNLFDKIKASIASTFCNAASRAVRIAELIKAGSVDLIDAFAMNRFKSLNLPADERFIYEFKCSVPTGDFVATGYAVLTQHFLIFHGIKKNVTFERVRFSIPLWKVKSLHRAKTTRGLMRQPRFSCVDMATYADAALVYTDDHHVHVFFEFISLFCCDYVQEFLYVFDYTWRDLARESALAVRPSPTLQMNSASDDLDL